MLTREGKNLPLTEITAKNYLVEDNERGFYHCRLERRLFDGATGERLSRPFVQKFDAKGFAGLYRNLVESGYDVEVLHDPTAKPKDAPVVKDVPAEVLDFTADEPVTAVKEEKPRKGGK
jgi:hypothetical protein